MIAAGLISGKATLADVLFLIAAVLFVLAALVAWRPLNDRPFWCPLACLGLALVAVALLVL